MVHDGAGAGAGAGGAGVASRGGEGVGIISLGMPGVRAVIFKKVSPGDFDIYTDVSLILMVE